MKRSKIEKQRAARRRGRRINTLRKNPAFGKLGDQAIHNMLADSSIVAACAGMTLDEKLAVPGVIAIAQASGVLRSVAAKLKHFGERPDQTPVTNESTESPT